MHVALLDNPSPIDWGYRAIAIGQHQSHSSMRKALSVLLAIEH